MNDPFDAWVLRDNAQSAPNDGPLAGMTFGVKDVIDVRGLPTRGGVEVDAPPAAIDAWCVAALRAAGAVPIGKTRTTAFAFRDPAITRNPRALGRTPGGSSSGSAAAVAAGEVPFALGTQTLGSTLRPAAFCGIVGYKPSFGTVPTAGMRPLAPSLDHIGVLGRDVAAVAAVARAWGIGTAGAPRRAVLARDYVAEHLDDESRAAVDAVGAVLGELEIETTRRDRLPREREILDAANIVNAFEAYALLGTEPGATPAFAELLARGAAIPYETYRTARDERPRALDAYAALLDGDTVAVVPVAGPAPDMTSTGNPAPQAPATFLGLPSLTIPAGTFRDGTPRGVQCIAGPGRDAMLLAFAAAVERALAVVA